jgi:peptide/nickel transport system substrate-binding protein
MNALKWTLLIATAALLVYMAVDRWREPQQLQRVSQSLDRLETALQDLARSQKQLAEAMARLQSVEQGARPAAVVTTATTKSISVADVDPKIRDGNPKLNVNFLMPYDRSYYHADKQGGTLKIFEDTPRRLNPLIDSSAITQRVQAVTTDSLCDRPPTHPEQWSESLATSVIISDDYKIYTFNLRRGVKWQRPVLAQQKEYAWLTKEVELTAADFKFAVDLILDPAVDCPSLRNYYEDIEKAEVVDDYTLRLVWKKKTYNSLAASLGLAPLPRHVYGRNSDGSVVPADKLGVNFNQHWFDELHAVVGVGAYILEEYVPDKIMRLRRNPDYWGVLYHFDAIEWNMEIKKDDAQLIAFKNGLVHAYGLMPNYYKSEILDHNEPRFAALDPNNPKAGRMGELAWERVKKMQYTYLGWNLRREPFNDKRVRQAMSHALPKERIIKDVFFGLGIPVLSDVAPGTQYANTELKPYAFDLERAKTLLAEAGWKDSDGDGVLDRMINGTKKDFRFVMKYMANTSTYDNMMLIYKNELRKIGIEMIPRPIEWKEIMRSVEDRDFEALMSGWQTDWEIDYFQLWHSSQAEVQGGSNHGGFVNARVDELAVKLRETFDTPARIAIAKELQAIIHEEQPYTFLTSAESILIWQNKGKPAKGQYLDGVDESLDQLHPLTRTVDRRMFWNFRQ